MGGCGAPSIPDCGVELKGEDDVTVAADLADEAALGAEVAVVDVLGGELDQGLEEPFVRPFRDLSGHMRAAGPFRELCGGQGRLQQSVAAAAPGALPTTLLLRQQCHSTWARNLPRSP